MDNRVNQLRLFEKSKDAKPFAAGEVIFKEGDAGDFLYVVVSGKVAMKHGDTVLEHVEAGGIFGEMALLDNEKRSATAVAETDSQLVPVNSSRFQFLVQQTPFFAVHVMKVMADRLRRLTKQLN